ncbi:hypothetical protein GCM10010531_09690 [Blastococcus jejuensis]|uniref:DUF4386 domain-containing protein n=1 Tax=Blastococcus jejuensis TaxID=351224 RepID=A0ABP6NWS7_9ACTN
MTTQTAPAPLRHRPATGSTRLGAALGIAGIVLIATGFAIAAPTEATITSPESEVVAFYTGAGLATTLTGGLVESLGLLLFLPFAAMLTARLRVPGTTADLLAPTARMAATVYVAICLAPGMSAGATALWLAQHGSADPTVLTALNDLRALSYFVALLAYAVFLLAAGAAGLTSGRLPRWASWAAVALGGALAAGVPFAADGFADVFGLLGLVWVVVVSVALLRRPGIVVSAAEPVDSDA